MTSLLFRATTARCTASDGRFLFTDLFRRYRLSTLFAGTKAFYALRRFLFDKQRVMALGALPRYRCEVNDKLTIRIAIAGMKVFAIARAALHQVTLLARGADDGRFIWLINNLCVVTLRILTASDEHAKAPLAQHQHGTTFRTRLPLQNFDDMSVRLAFQGTNVIAFRIMGTAEKRPVFTGPYDQFGPALWAGLVFRHRKQCRFDHNNS